MVGRAAQGTSTGFAGGRLYRVAQRAGIQRESLGEVSVVWIAWLVLLAGCEQATVAPIVSMEIPSAPVRVQAVAEGVLDEGWLLDGEVRALEHARLSALVTGEIRSADVSEGQMVEQGALLVEVDPAMIKARMERVKAEAGAAWARGSAARGEAERLGALGGSAAAAQAAAIARAQEAEAESAAIRAKVEELSVELVRHEVRAPFRGVIARRFHDRGDFVYAGDPVVELVSLGEVEVVIDGPAGLVGDVETGQTATIIGRDVVLGEIVGVVPVRDPVTQTVRVRIKPNEPRDWLIAGAEVGVQLPLVRTSEAVVVPEAALLRGDLGVVVIRVAEERAVPVQVTPVARDDQGRVLLLSSALHAGDLIVVDGHHRLRPGQLLTVQAEE